MIHDYQMVARALKEARERNGLSQRAPAQKSGVLQARISRIKSGSADFRLSTLLGLARALDLELALVPRKALAAVQSVVGAVAPVGRGQSSGEALKALQRVQQAISGFAGIDRVTAEYAQFQRSLRDLQKLPLDQTSLGALGQLRKTLQESKDADPKEILRRGLAEIQALRNDVVRATAAQPHRDKVKPAYSLDEDEDEHG